ncbi:MAG: peptidoglycan DD-metalloendopeptidase family protein [Candidatus Paceibacterota bacterium]
MKKTITLSAVFLSISILSVSLFPFDTKAQVVQDIPIPMLFGVSLSNLKDTFGEPRPGGRTHEGIDIISIKGNPIVSPIETTVTGIGVWTGGGNFVTTSGPNGEEFRYMHLDRVADINIGDRLSVGDIIGYNGNTGNASGGVDHLHLEIRPNNTATNPYPIITVEFTLAQKISFLEKILQSESSPTTLAELLVKNFRSIFESATANGITLPTAITNALQTVPQTTTVTKTISVATVALALPTGDLDIGSKGTAVIALQKFLIVKDSGPRAQYLGRSGATGSFGPITQSALIEYQKAVGITPASGYYGPVTRAFIEKDSVVVTKTTQTATVAVSVTTSGMPKVNLTLGAKGTSVIWLQKFLIAKDSGTAAKNLAKSGATGYFGNVTKLALIEYQKKSGITPAAGYFGAITRSVMASVNN